MTTTPTATDNATPHTSVTSLSQKQLAAVLKELCNGSIGFDVYRDPRTKTKELLLRYILNNYENTAIIDAITTVRSKPDQAVAQTAQDTTTWLVDQINAQAQHLAGGAGIYVDDSISASATDAALERMKAIAAKKPPKAAPVSTSDAEQLAALLARMAGNAAPTASIDEQAVQRLIDKAIAKISVPQRIELLNPVTQTTHDIGIQHESFPDLLAACQAREVSGNRMNIWLHGPAGTGKTHAAHAVAEALKVPFQSNGTLLTEHSLSGFIDATGHYHRTAFREIFEHGGVYLGDEYDVWCPKAAMWLQAALANGYTRFPDGMIKRHADCVVIFGANTTGKGATADYSTRNKVDEANSNRVVFIHWPLDEKLEKAISPNAEWTRHVQSFRRKVESRKIKGHMITPRQSTQGAALLAAGLPWEKVEVMVLKRGLSDDQWDQVR